MIYFSSNWKDILHDFLMLGFNALVDPDFLPSVDMMSKCGEGKQIDVLTFFTRMTTSKITDKHVKGLSNLYGGAWLYNVYQTMNTTF